MHKSLCVITGDNFTGQNEGKEYVEFLKPALRASGSL